MAVPSISRYRSRIVSSLSKPISSRTWRAFSTRFLVSTVSARAFCRSGLTGVSAPAGDVLVPAVAVRDETDPAFRGKLERDDAVGDSPDFLFRSFDQSGHGSGGIQHERHLHLRELRVRLRSRWRRTEKGGQNQYRCRDCTSHPLHHCTLIFGYPVWNCPVFCSAAYTWNTFRISKAMVQCRAACMGRQANIVHEPHPGHRVVGR